MELAGMQIERVEVGQSTVPIGFADEKIAHDPATVILKIQISGIAGPHPGIFQGGQRGGKKS